MVLSEQSHSAAVPGALFQLEAAINCSVKEKTLQTKNRAIVRLADKVFLTIPYRMLLVRGDRSDKPSPLRAQSLQNGVSGTVVKRSSLI